MSRFLQEILNTEEPQFSAGLLRLEKATGHSGVDVRLIADITENAHKVMRYLKLDPSDTTGRELYHSLITAIKHNSIQQFLENMSYVLMVIDHEIISFNLIDLIESSHHELPFGKHKITHGQQSLSDELVKRYINHPRTDEGMVNEVSSFIGLLPERK